MTSLASPSNPNDMEFGVSKISIPYNYLAATYLFVICLAGVIGNVWMVVCYVRKNLRCKYTSLSLNLALSQLLMVVSIPLKIINLFLNRFMFGWLGCNVIAAVNFISGVATICTLLAMSVERYYTLINPRAVDKLPSFVWLFTIWGIGIVCGIVPLLGWGRYDTEPHGLDCAIDWDSDDPKAVSSVYCIFAFVYFLPLTIMIIFYCKVWNYSRSKRRVEPLGDTQCNNYNITKAHWKSTWASFGMLLSFFICWTPYAVVSLLGTTGMFAYGNPAFSLIAPLIAKTSTLANPLIYFLTHSPDSDVEPTRDEDPSGKREEQSGVRLRRSELSARCNIAVIEVTPL